MEYWNTGDRKGPQPPIVPSFHHSTIPILRGFVLGLVGLLLAGAGGGCQKDRAKSGSKAVASPAELGPTIGSLADVVKAEPVAVEGYGLVGGLAGTGSGYCPPEVHAYLKQYILTQLPGERVDIDAVLNSKNTAVVALEAMIPATPSMGESFDVRVALPAGSEATSLQGGWLYKAELVVKGTFGARTKPLATVKGPVFINQVGTAEVESRSGYILGGGRTLYEYTAILLLRKADYRAASLIRNRLSERYGSGIAQALSPGAIEVRIPANYRGRKPRFIAMIPATFLEATNELTSARIDAYVKGLITPEGGSGSQTRMDRVWGPGATSDASEIALEAVGPQSVVKLSALLNAPDAGVRLRAGRCMLGLRDNRGLTPLRDLAADPASPYRFEALEAVMVSGRREDAASLGRRLLRDDDARMVLAAYEHLRRMDDAAVAREEIGRGFLLEQVVQSSHKAIFVSRSGVPRVVLFGAPLRCRDNLFVESPDQVFVLNSRAGQGFVSVIRKHPTRPGVIGPLRSTPDVGNLVRILGGEAVAGTSGQRPGVSASYTQVIALLEQLSIKGAIAAEFWPGPLPKMDLGIKK